ncbi:zinc finger protein 596-like [Culicoides brevitarsis]|uniref:zinc finger protein 596-like n=1 Tax=Culicoides brevitarsis TaxID=469753 RepID=UPI00307BA4EF
MEDLCLICFKEIPSKNPPEVKVVDALRDIFRINVFEGLFVCEKCKITLFKFHDFYQETLKNYEKLKKLKIPKLEVISEDIPVKIEEFFDESTVCETFLEAKSDAKIDEKRKNSSQRRKSSKKRASRDPYICDLCGKSIRRFVDLRSHIEKTHLRLRKFQCHLCGDNFFASNNLKFHLTTHDKSRPRSKCNICGVLVLDLKKHFRTSHNDSNPVVCNICGKSLMNEMKLRYHTYKRHPPQGKFRCNICDKDFCNALYLKEHTHQKHIGGFLYTCDWCDFQTNYSKNMPTHQKLKHKEEYEARRRARPAMMSRVHEMKATLALQGQVGTEGNVT